MATSLGNKARMLCLRTKVNRYQDTGENGSLGRGDMLAGSKIIYRLMYQSSNRF